MCRRCEGADELAVNQMVEIKKLEADLASRDQQIAAMRDALEAAQDHLVYCAWGNADERQEARDEGLPEKISKALKDTSSIAERFVRREEMELAVNKLLAEIEERKTQSETIKQLRSQRESALQSKLEAAEKERDAAQQRAEALQAELDKLRSNQ